MHEIVVQGEGFGGDGPDSDLAPITFGAPDSYVRNYEFSHYDRFARIVEGFDAIGNVWPLA